MTGLAMFQRLIYLTPENCSSERSHWPSVSHKQGCPCKHPQLLQQIAVEDLRRPADGQVIVESEHPALRQLGPPSIRAPSSAHLRSCQTLFPWHLCLQPHPSPGVARRSARFRYSPWVRHHHHVSSGQGRALLGPSTPGSETQVEWLGMPVPFAGLDACRGPLGIAPTHPAGGSRLENAQSYTWHPEHSAPTARSGTASSCGRCSSLATHPWYGHMYSQDSHKHLSVSASCRAWCT
mmetsp:Transcript_71563/g.141943  ORF Transcript_71563/g.141943 Transcript_71563/m.141943 type:complete len:236 (+) Transcript_71563:346-1053(+)